jgi:hypothetical protein
MGWMKLLRCTLNNLLYTDKVEPACAEIEDSLEDKLSEAHIKYIEHTIYA